MPILFSARTVDDHPPRLDARKVRLPYDRTNSTSDIGAASVSEAVKPVEQDRCRRGDLASFNLKAVSDAVSDLLASIAADGRRPSYVF